MTKRMALLSTLIVSLVLLPGCPGGVSALLGTWVFTINQVATGIELKANGEVELFSIANGPTLFGTINWEVNGSRFILSQFFSNNRTAYIAENTSNTMMSGAWVTWAGPGVGGSDTWNAVKQ